jgi:Na+-translocating ferredoxin:NAD+ oxidoreductase RnfD subunit
MYLERSMNAATPAPLPWRRFRRFLRSPKGYLLLALVPLALLAAPSTGFSAAAAGVFASVAGALVMDLLLVRMRQGVWRLSTSALLTGLIVGMILSAQEPWYVAAAAAVLAIDAKHFLRIGRVHVFNPAAAGLLAVFVLFHSGQSWWGALANLPAPAIVLLLVAGVIVANRANKLPAALAFLGVYVALCTSATFLGRAASVADLFRPPFVNMALYFAFFMVTDPPTSPVPFPAQIWFGAGVAAISVGAYLATHGLYYLLAGILIANAGYALWQLAVRAYRRSPIPDMLEAAPEGIDGRAMSVLAGAFGVVLLFVLAAGVVAFHSQGQSGDDARQPVSAGVTDLRTQSTSGAAGLPFQDRFTGTIAQSTGPTGTTVSIQIAGNGDRPVQLQIDLLVTQATNGGGRVQNNQAVLTDATGEQLCRGQVTQLDSTGFAVRCQGAGSYAGTALQVMGTFTTQPSSQVQGDLQVQAAN